MRNGSLFLVVLGLGGEELWRDVGDNTSLRDDNVAEELVEFLIVTDGELQVSGNDTLLLVITSGVSCELENLSREVFEDYSIVSKKAK